MFPDLSHFIGYLNSHAFILKTYSDSIHLHIQINPGRFSNDDSASNENVKKAKMSKKKTNKLCKCITLFWYTSLPSLHDKDMKFRYAMLFGGRKHQ